MASSRLTKLLAFSGLLLFLAGCNNGLDCPIDPPSCCYDALFGCELFDLPMGCSCSQYGFVTANAKQSLTSAASTASQKSPGLSGSWSGVLSQNSSSCPGFLPKVSGLVKVRTQKNSVKITVPGYGTLKGKARTRNRLTASGKYTEPLSSCKAEVTVSIASARAGLGRVGSKVKLDCGRALQCSSQYVGMMQKR